MLDMKVIRADPDRVRASVRRRHIDPARADVDRLLEVDAAWRETLARADALRAERKRLSSGIRALDGEAREAAIARVRGLKEELAAAEARLEALEGERQTLLRAMPNLLDPAVPDGRTDDDNVELARWGEPRAFDFAPRDHVEIGARTDTLDLERGARVAGAGFYYLKREAVLLEQALCAYAAARLLPAGFVPLATPDLARDAILDGIGFAPRGPETQVYSVEGHDLSLVGTAEITIGGYHAGEILPPGALPLRYLGFSHCFRTEAGAHGRASRGLYRVHQFTKAEMFVLCAPEDSPAMHEELRAHEEALLRGLGLPYRVVEVCAGELGAPAARKFDIEAWMPGRGGYGEVTSCSNCTDYQARRLEVRYRPAPGAAPRLVHMLNGTAIAVSRVLLAIYENYQEEDGGVVVPEALRPWMGGVARIPARG